MPDNPTKDKPPHYGHHPPYAAVCLFRRQAGRPDKGNCLESGEQQMMQYGDVKPATEADVSGKLENLRRLMEQPPVPEDGEFSEEDIDKYVFGVRVYEDRFEWLLNLSPEARGELDDAGSPVYFTKLTVTPDDERAWFKMHPQWSKSNKYAELEAWIYI